MSGAVFWLAVAAALALPPTSAFQAPPDPSFVVIVNKENPARTLALAELRRMFMKQTRMWPHGEAIVPVDWDATSPYRAAFSERVLSRTVRQMADYWVQQGVMQGLTPPSTQRSARALLRFVASVPGAIGYVPPGDVDDTVAVIKVTGLP